MSSGWPHPAYRIETARLVMRCYQPGDAAELLRAVDHSREHLRPWMPWARQVSTLEERVELIRRFRGDFDLGNDFTYGIYDADSQQQIGGCGLHTRVGPGALEIGYWIAGDRVRQGLATETAGALTRVGFEVMKVQRMVIHCDPANVASAGVPAKLGYSRDGVLRLHQALPDGSRRDTLVHTMTADDYLVSPAAAVSVRAFGADGRTLL